MRRGTLDHPELSDHNIQLFHQLVVTMEVPIRELKARLSRYIDDAQREPIVVTSHGKPVARLVGLQRAENEGLARLLASGAATWGGGKPSGASIRLSDRGSPVSEILLEDRS